MEEDDVQIVKLTQEVRKGQQPKFLFLKEDEGYTNDFQRVVNTIRDSIMDKRSIGRPILVNSHIGRGISPLSRNAVNQSYRGLVNILIICLIASNAQNILNILNNQGWVFGKFFVDAAMDSSYYKLKNLWYIIYGQHLITGPIISY